jgi:hypothetical protein
MKQYFLNELEKFSHQKENLFERRNIFSVAGKNSVIVRKFAPMKEYILIQWKKFRDHKENLPH